MQQNTKNLEFEINSWNSGVYGGNDGGNRAGVLVEGIDPNHGAVSAALSFYRNQDDLKPGYIQVGGNGQLQANAYFPLDVYSEVLEILTAPLKKKFYINTEVGIQGSGIQLFSS